jgi:hypothetical protein
MLLFPHFIPFPWVSYCSFLKDQPIDAFQHDRFTEGLYPEGETKTLSSLEASRRPKNKKKTKNFAKPRSFFVPSLQPSTQSS